MSANLLGRETSPYLLQHKDNPVHWRPWSAAALAEARASGKPILLSIGYAACHWCHVMAHESFEDDEVAAVMNRHFVNIKVDREERPDVDAIYMSALHMLGEQGGWPLTMFLTPDGEPFWGGTYFPKTPRFGRPGFIQLLEEIARIFREEPDKIEHNRAALIGRLREQASSSDPATLPPGLPRVAAERLLSVMDDTNGGLQGAPKFPQPSVLELLWRAGSATSDARYRQTVFLALTRMSQGGIYDHLGGGYARYSVDARWLVPHFEKMLYDNAQLIDLLALASAETRTPLFAARIEETVAWLVREMRLPGGAFASSLDADSEGEEGRFYVWQADEIRDILGDDHSFFAAHYDITPAGNWEGKTILNRLVRPELASQEDESRLAELRARLFRVRERRVRPALDDKILADWNGLAIHALARAGFIFSRPDWMGLAHDAFSFVAESMSEKDRLLHSYREGRAAQKGLLADYANMARAAIALYETTGERHYLDRALGWNEVLDTRFLSADGAYFMTPDDADDLIVRPRSGLDDAMPNGNAVSAANRLRLWRLTGDARHRDRAEAIFSTHAADIARNVFGFAGMLNARDFAERGADVVIVAKDPSASGALVDQLRRVADPALTLTRLADGADLPVGHPAHGKGAKDDKETAYVCTSAGCSLPVTDAEDLKGLLDRALVAPGAG